MYKRQVATKGTAKWLAGQDVPSEAVAKVYEGRPNIVDRLKNNDIALVMNTTEGTQAVSDSRDIPRVALMDMSNLNTTHQFDVIIVGSGGAGLSLALSLSLIHI